MAFESCCALKAPILCSEVSLSPLVMEYLYSLYKLDWQSSLALFYNIALIAGGNAFDMHTYLDSSVHILIWIYYSAKELWGFGLPLHRCNMTIMPLKTVRMQKHYFVVLHMKK